jgi:hypothetical protein
VRLMRIPNSEPSNVKCASKQQVRVRVCAWRLRVRNHEDTHHEPMSAHARRGMVYAAPGSTCPMRIAYHRAERPVRTAMGGDGLNDVSPVACAMVRACASVYVPSVRSLRPDEDTVRAERSSAIQSKRATGVRARP